MSTAFEEKKLEVERRGRVVVVLESGIGYRKEAREGIQQLSHDC